MLLTPEQEAAAREEGLRRRAEAAPAKSAAPAKERETSAGEYAKTFAESAAAGVLSVPGAIAGIAGTGLEKAGLISPETGQAVRDSAGGRAMLANLVGAGTQIAGGNTAEASESGELARAEYSEAARARSEANPLTAFAGEVGGQVAGLSLTGGLGGLPARASKGVTGLLGGGAVARMAGAAAGTAIEGAVIGIGAQLDEAWLKEQHLTGQQLLASVGFNGLLSGVLGFGGGALAQGVRSARSSIADRLAPKAVEAAEEAAPALTERSMAQNLLKGDDEAIGNVYRATTGQAAEETMPRFYREIVKGHAPAEGVTDKASRALYEHSTAVEGNLSKVTEEVTQRATKLEHVAENFRKAPPPAGAVIKARETALQLWDEVQQLERSVTDNVASSLKAGGIAEARAASTAATKASALTKLRVELARGVKEIATTDDAAKAYIAADQMRRNLLSTLDSVGAGAAQSSDPLMKRILPEAAESLRSTYQKAADHLFDSSVWGQQGAAQKRVNDAWVDFINARKNVFRGFADQTGEKLLPNGQKIPQFDMRETSLARLVGDMTGPGARDASRRWTQYLDSTERLTNAIGEGYALSGAKSEALAALNQGVKGVRETVTSAARDLQAIKQATELLHAGHATHVEQGIGALAGAAVGGAMGGPVGAAAGSYLGKAVGGAASPANLLEHRVQMQIVAERVKRNLSGALDAYFGGIDRVASAGAAAGAAVKRAVEPARRAALASGAMAKASALPTAMQALQGRAKSPEEGYRKRAEQVIAMTADNGRGVADAAAKALWPVAANDPHAAMAFVTSATKAAEYLKSKLPAPLLNQNSLTPLTNRPIPSRMDLHEFAQVAQALDHPTEVIARGLATGTLSQPVVQAIKTVYPDYYDWVREQTMQRIAQRDEEGRPLPLRQVAVLDTLLDLQGAGSRVLSDDFALQHGPMIGAKQTQEMAPTRTSARSQTGDRMAPPTSNFMSNS